MKHLGSVIGLVARISQSDDSVRRFHSLTVYSL